MTNPTTRRERAVRFYTVGAAGIVVQLGVLYFLTRGMGFDYMVSTALAVEAAVIHNFLWHDRWTWRCPKFQADAGQRRLVRFCKFNLSAGCLSIVTNLVVMRALVEYAGVPHLAANLLAIATVSAVSFLVADTLVFAR